MVNNGTYTKSIDEPLIFIECVQLLETLIENGIIQKDLNNKDNILVYHLAGTENPEGWYSENILTSASELLHDEESQQFLRDVLEEKGISLKFKKVF